MKVCIISPMMLPIPALKGGAIETIIDQIIKENEKQMKIEIDCFSVIPDDIDQSKIRFGETNLIYIEKIKNGMFINILNYLIKIISKLTSSKRDYVNKTYKKISELTKDKGYDYIVFEGGDYSCARYFLKYYKRENMVLHLHHLLSVPYYDEYFGTIICVSEFVKKKLCKSTIEKVERIEVLKNVVDPMIFECELNIHQKMNLRENLGIRSDEKVLFFCGRIIKEKGIRELILAFNKISNKNVKLLVAGSSNFGQETLTSFEKEVFELIGKNDNIVYLGFVDNKEVHKYYRIADIFIMPSIWEEPAGLVNIEAILCDTPIIATNMGGIPEYVNEDVGMLVKKTDSFVDDLASTIEYLLNHDEILEIMRMNCSNYKNDITLEKYYLNFTKLLNIG